MSKIKCCKKICNLHCRYPKDSCYLEKTRYYDNTHSLSDDSHLVYVYEYSKSFIENKINLYQNLYRSLNYVKI